MKQYLNYFAAIFVFTLFSACSSERKPGHNLEKISWLPGKWANTTAEGESAEIWKKQNDSTYTGIGYLAKGTDTLFSEKLQLKYLDGELCYLPTIPDQNNGQPVKFKLKTLTDTSMVFENPEHDFPQLITYVLFNKDSLVAEISGSKDGQKHAEIFPMRRVR